MTPDVAFENAANRAAALYATAPLFVSYRVRAHVSIPAVHRERDIDRAVDVRTRDDLAILQDLPQGKRQTARSFPIPPTFDPLSYFTLVGRGGLHDALEAYVHDVHPLQYDLGSRAGSDVVVQGLRAYRVVYAADSSTEPGGYTHLVLTPYAFFTKLANAKSALFFRDVYVANATGLPARVSFAGAFGRFFEVDLGTVAGHPVVERVAYEENLTGPVRLGMLHVSIRATYDRYAFPAIAPAPELAR